MRWKTVFWLAGFWGLTAGAVCVNGHPSIASEFRSSNSVVLATVTVIEKVPASQTGDFLDGTLYHVKVQKRFKGGNSANLDIFSENSSGRFDMTNGESYLLFIYVEAGRLSVDNCGNSGVAAQRSGAIQQVAKLAHRSVD